MSSPFNSGNGKKVFVQKPSTNFEKMENLNTVEKKTLVERAQHCSNMDARQRNALGSDYLTDIPGRARIGGQPWKITKETQAQLIAAAASSSAPAASSSSAGAAAPAPAAPAVVPGASKTGPTAAIDTTKDQKPGTAYMNPVQAASYMEPNIPTGILLPRSTD